MVEDVEEVAERRAWLEDLFLEFIDISYCDVLNSYLELFGECCGSIFTVVEPFA